MAQIKAWPKNVVVGAWFAGFNGDWGGLMAASMVDESNATTVTPPIESTRDGHPCEWVVDEWLLLTSGEAFAAWESDNAKRELADEDNIGNLQRAVEELVDHVANGTALSQFTIDKVAERKAKRAKIK